MTLMARKTVDKLLRRFPPDVLRGGVIRWWLREHAMAASHLTSEGKTQEFLDACDATAAATVEEELSATKAKPALKDVEAAFERIIDDTRRKQQGAIYTPDHIIDYLIAEACESVTAGTVRFLDPACGSGGFLVRAAAYLSARNGVPLRKSLIEAIAGADNDPDALEHARCLVELFAAEHSETIRPDELLLICRDSLLTPPEQLLADIRAPGGVQVLATNPPYVKLQTLDSDYRAALAERYPGFTQYNFSLAILFLIAGRRLLAADGTLAYITQNNLFTSFAGEPVRRALQEKRSVRRIVDFGHHRVFKGVLAYACLIFLDREHHDLIEFERIEKDVSLRELRALNFGRVPLASLNPNKWRLAKPVHLKNLHKIETIGTPVGSIADIRVGFATLKDKVFFVDPGGSHCVARHPETGRRYEVETALTRPAIRVADIRDESQIDAVTRRIIFPYRRVNGNYAVIPEEDLQSNYPQAFRYLSESRSVLESRDKGKRSYEAWYAWGRTQGRDAPGPKLLTKTFSTRPQFFFDPTDRLFCNGYAVFAPQPGLFNQGVRIEHLKAILESRVMHYYAKLTSFQIDGDYQCYQKNFIERFTVPELPSALQEALISGSPREVDAVIAGIYDIPTEQLAEVVGPTPEAAGAIRHDEPREPQRGRGTTGVGSVF